jgi:hypothetical protein
MLSMPSKTDPGLLPLSSTTYLLKCLIPQAEFVLQNNWEYQKLMACFAYSKNACFIFEKRFEKM